jgi:hypothetical protein
MKTKIIQVTNNDLNWGKFLVGEFDEREWDVPCAFPEGSTISMMRARGMHKDQYLVLDLETKEGAVFGLTGSSRADLNDKHRIWVCPMYEPFLEWLYASYRDYLSHIGTNLDWLERLPASLDLKDAEFAMAGYRRQGKRIT